MPKLFRQPSDEAAEETCVSTATLPLTAKRTPIARSDPARLVLAACAGIYAAMLRGLHHNIHLGTLFMDPYWVNFYCTSYQDGFRRRALVGSLIRLLSPHAADIRWLNLLAVVTVFALLGILLAAFHKVCLRAAPLAALFAFALFASAFFSVDFEVLGDTLQIALLLFLVAAILSSRWCAHPSLQAATLCAAMGVAFLIHEASLFFLAPCIPFVLHRSPRLRHFVLPALAAVTLFAVSAHWSAVDAHLTYPVHLYPHKAALTEPAGTPGFRSLLQTEYLWDFGTPGNTLRFADRCLAVALMVFASLIALAHCITRRAFDRILHILTWMCFFSAPLWIIAHDWGRFMGYNLLLAIALSLWHQHAPANTPRGIASIAGRIFLLSRYEPIQLATVLLLLASPFVHNRDLVLRPAEVESAAGILILMALAYSTRTFTALNSKRTRLKAQS